MPSNATLRRQRTLGGALGIIVLGCALTYHFFPRVFHVDPTQAPRRSMSMGTAAPASGLQPERTSAISEIDAGPPLTLAPAAVIAAHSSKNANLPEQMSADPPAVQALLARAAKALHAGQLAGDANSAAALFAQALKDKPDSRRAAQGMFDVRARLVAEID
ncbi:MAG TPA: formylglycine-generating enzyme family protein, partial [Rhodanobacter sp.]|nr:formylglycine-generating enzyme family protein [Rhodanobacter sp.]